MYREIHIHLIPFLSHFLSVETEKIDNKVTEHVNPIAFNSSP